jgi:hypothetical protein
VDVDARGRDAQLIPDIAEWSRQLEAALHKLGKGPQYRLIDVRGFRLEPRVSQNEGE